MHAANIIDISESGALNSRSYTILFNVKYGNIIVYYAMEAAHTDIYRVQTYIKSIKHT